MRSHSILQWSRGVALSWIGYGRQALNYILMGKLFKPDQNQLCDQQGKNTFLYKKQITKPTSEYMLKQLCQVFQHRNNLSE